MKHFLYVIFIPLFIMAFPLLSGAEEYEITSIQIILKGNTLNKDTSYDFIESRVKNYNPKTKIIRQNDSILIKIPEIIDSTLCKDLLTEKGELLIAETYSSIEFYPVLERIDSLLSTPGMAKIKYQLINRTPDNDEPEVLYIYNAEQGDPYDKYPVNLLDILHTYSHSSSAIGYVYNDDKTRIDRLFKDSVVKKYLPDDAYLLWEFVDTHKPMGTLYAVKKPKVGNNLYIDESMVDSVSLKYDDYTDACRINIKLKDAYHKTWEDLTAKNVGNALTIVINGNVIMAPTVMDKIRGGSFDVSGYMQETNAKTITAMLGSNGYLNNEDIEIISVKQEYASIHYLKKLLKIN